MVSSGGTLLVASRGIADPTLILSGGTEIVSAGGDDFGAQISGGTQVVFGLAQGATAFGGAQIVRSGGVAVGTIVSGGSAVVSARGGEIDAEVDSGGTRAGQRRRQLVEHNRELRRPSRHQYRRHR